MFWSSSSSCQCQSTVCLHLFTLLTIPFIISSSLPLSVCVWMIAGSLPLDVSAVLTAGCMYLCPSLLFLPLYLSKHAHTHCDLHLTFSMSHPLLFLMCTEQCTLQSHADRFLSFTTLSCRKTETCCWNYTFFLMLKYLVEKIVILSHNLKCLSHPCSGWRLTSRPCISHPTSPRQLTVYLPTTTSA